MEIICTYCSSSKDPTIGLIPAYKRYISSRIVKVQEIAETDNLPFFILSGQFGLIPWDKPLPWYDHLLTINEVPNLSKTVVNQLSQTNVTILNFYTRSPEIDKNLIPYIELIQIACEKATIELRIHLLPEINTRSAIRNWKEIMEKAADARLLMINDKVENQQAFDDLLHLFPEDGMIYFQRGSGYETLGDYHKALSDYKMAGELFPLQRWKNEALQAMERLEEKISKGGTITEAKKRLNTFSNLNDRIIKHAIYAISRTMEDPNSAAIQIRALGELLVKDILLSKKPNQILSSDFFENTKSLDYPEKIATKLVVNNFHTIRNIGNQAAHLEQIGQKHLSVNDVYPAITSLIAILEWMNTQGRFR